MKMSREAITKLSVVAACAAAAVVSSCLFAFSGSVLPPIQGTILFPLVGERVVQFAVWQGDDGSHSEELATVYPYHSESEEEQQEAEALRQRVKALGYDQLRPIEEYDNVVSVSSPTKDQVILREEYSVEENGETIVFEAILYGDGHREVRPVEDGQK